MSELQQKKRRRKQKKRAPEGEFVWVLDGKTHHPARLVIPRLESNIRGTRSAKVEVCWTQTGLFQWVDEKHVSYLEEGNGRQQRSRRSSSSMKQDLDSTRGMKTTKHNKIIKPRGTPRKTSKAARKSDEKLAALSTIEDEPPAKKKKKQPTSQPMTPPPLSSFYYEYKTDTVANTNDNLLGLITPSKAEKCDHSKQSATETVLDTISAPISSAKQMIVSGFLGLYKGLIGSSTSS